MQMTWYFLVTFPSTKRDVIEITVRLMKPNKRMGEGHGDTCFYRETRKARMTRKTWQDGSLSIKRVSDFKYLEIDLMQLLYNNA